MSDRAIGERTCTDGQRRTVYLDQSGRQYVLDSEGRRLYGVWLVVAEEDTADIPVIVEPRP